jgi:hypothetical protein
VEENENFTFYGNRLRFRLSLNCRMECSSSPMDELKGGRERKMSTRWGLVRLLRSFSLTADLSLVLVGILNVRNESGMRLSVG